MDERSARRKLVPALALGTLMAVVLVAWGIAENRLEDTNVKAQPASLQAAGHEMWSSAAPRDWATNADHVVDLQMIGEKPGYADAQLQDRVGAFRVNKVLFSRAGAPPLPTEFEMKVAGWSIAEDGGRVPLVFARGASRLEPGHRYVAALIHLEPRCNPDDGVDPGGWSTIGSLGALPLEDGVLGRGELEGRSHESEVSPGSILASVRSSGLTLSGLVTLIEASPRAVRAPQPGERVGC